MPFFLPALLFLPRPRLVTGFTAEPAFTSPSALAELALFPAEAVPAREVVSIPSPLVVAAAAAISSLLTGGFEEAYRL